MRLLKLLAFFLFPLFVFGSPLSSQYVESFIYHFQAEEFPESLQILDDWEVFEPEQKSKIIGMKAAVYLSTGDFERGSLIALLVNTFFLPKQFFLFGLKKSEGSPWFFSGSFSWRSLLLILLSHYNVRSKRPDNVLHGF
jgi:hypothetical protein